MLTFGLFPIALASIALLLARFCLHQWQQSRFMSKAPWIGTDGKIFFPKWRARIQNVGNFKTVIQNAYHRYSLNNQTVVLPTLASDLILLPPNHIDWIINQPDSVLSSIEPHVHSLQSDLTFPHPDVIRKPAHHLVISRELTRHLGNLTHDIVDELSNAVDLFWPKDEDQFQNVHVFGTMMRVVARTSNRIFVGAPLCQNEAYLASVAGFAREVPTWSARLKQLPSLIRPLVARYGLQQNRKHIREFTALVRPEVEKRQAALADMEKASELNPNDTLQWLVNRGEELGGIERDPNLIAGRLMALNFAAIHTSTFTITNVIFDLVASRPELRYIEQLREEAQTVLADGNGVWTKTGIAKMYKIDSALRESIRLGSFLGPGMTRKVMVKEGIVSPNGTHCPYGSNVAIATTGIHNDSTHYPESNTYNPFRFSKQRVSNNENGDKEDGDYIAKANLAFVSTSAIYHPFGHGKHCCPGRFFAANELKLLLAYLLLNYDFEMLGKRPESTWRGIVYLPPMMSSIRVRRRGKA